MELALFPRGKRHVMCFGEGGVRSQRVTTRRNNNIILWYARITVNFFLFFNFTFLFSSYFLFSERSGRFILLKQLKIVQLWWCNGFWIRNSGWFCDAYWYFYMGSGRDAGLWAAAAVRTALCSICSAFLPWTRVPLPGPVLPRWMVVPQARNGKRGRDWEGEI